jgi:hypothetical protein
VTVGFSNVRKSPEWRPIRAWLALAAVLPLLAACGSKSQDSLVGKNVDLNSIVETNANEVNVANDDLASLGAATAQSSPKAETSTNATLNRTAPTVRSSADRAPVEVERDSSAAGNETGADQTEDDTSAPSNLE